MKLLKSYHLQLFTLGIPIAILIWILFGFAPSLLVTLYYLHWLILGTLVWLLFSPWGKIRLSNSYRYSPLGWYLRLLTLQFALLASFFAISHLCGSALPILTIPHPHLFSQTLRQLLDFQGLYPWALYTLIAIFAGYHSYNQQQDTYLNHLLQPMIQSVPHQLLGATFNLFARISTLIALAFTLLTLSLLIIIQIPTSRPLATGMNQATMLITLSLLILYMIKPLRWPIRKLIQSKLSASLKFCLLLILLTTLLLILNLLYSSFSTTPIKTPFFVTLLNHHWLTSWQFFANGWWVSWMMVAGIVIARISKGYQIRTIILANLAGPLLIGILLIISHDNVRLDVIFTPRSINAIALLLGLFGGIGLAYFTLTKNGLPSLIQGYLPAADAVKHRSLRSFFNALIWVLIPILYLYLPAGIIVLTPLLLWAQIPMWCLGLAIMVNGWQRKS